MKKIVLLTLLLGLVVSANAGLVIMVKTPDSPVWGEYADSKFTIDPSDTILVGIMDMFSEAQPGPLALGIAYGPATITGDQVVAMDGVTASITDDAALAKDLGLQNMFLTLDIVDPVGAGLLVRDLVFHCEGPGDVTLAVVDENGLVLDTQVIHQTPEPATLALLGLGGLALRFGRKR